MNLFGKFLRWYSPKTFIRRGIARDQRIHAKKLKEAKHASTQERYDHEAYLHHELQQWYDWLEVIEDAEMVNSAHKMDISLEDFPLPERDKDDYRYIQRTHYEHADFGGRRLCDESRTALRKKMRERMPSYRKERREYWELWLKAGALVMGIMATATGFVATLKH